MGRLRLPLVGGLLVAVLGGASAHAQSGTDPAAAQVLFDAARKSMAKGDFASACPQLAESQRLDPAIGTLLNLADCYERSGKTASAWSRFLEAAEVARSLGQTSREKTARGRADALEPRLARVQIEVPAPSRLPGLSVTRDGILVGEALWGVASPVDPGEHTISVRAPGHRELIVKVNVAGGTQAVSIPVLQADTAGAAAPPPSAAVVAVPSPSATSPATTTPPPPPAEHAATWQRPTSYVLMGAGVVGLGLGTVFALGAKSKNDDSLSQCRPDDPTACTSEGKTERDSAKSKAAIATVSFTIGIVAAAAGVVLFATAPTPSTSAAVRVGPGSIALEGRF